MKYAERDLGVLSRAQMTDYRVGDLFLFRRRRMIVHSPMSSEAMAWGKCRKYRGGLDRGRLTDVFDAVIRVNQYPHTVAAECGLMWGSILIAVIRRRELDYRISDMMFVGQYTAGMRVTLPRSVRRLYLRCSVSQRLCNSPYRRLIPRIKKLSNHQASAPLSSTLTPCRSASGSAIPCRPSPLP